MRRAGMRMYCASNQIRDVGHDISESTLQLPDLTSRDRVLLGLISGVVTGCHHQRLVGW